VVCPSCIRSCLIQRAQGRTRRGWRSPARVAFESALLDKAAAVSCTSRCAFDSVTTFEGVILPMTCGTSYFRALRTADPVGQCWMRLFDTARIGRHRRVVWSWVRKPRNAQLMRRMRDFKLQGFVQLFVQGPSVSSSTRVFGFRIQAAAGDTLC